MMPIGFSIPVDPGPRLGDVDFSIGDLSRNDRHWREADFDSEAAVKPILTHEGRPSAA